MSSLITTVTLAWLVWADPALLREGGYWVEATSGSVPAPPSGHMRIVTTGSVAVKGVPQDKVQYTVRKRVRARTEAEARRLLSGVRVVSAGALKVNQAPDHPASVDLEVQLPRPVKQTSVFTRGGNVTITDLDGSVEVESVGGNLEVDRVGGAAILKTGGGEIRIGQISGPLRCISGGGSIRVQRTGGEAWLQTAGGEIHVAESGGSVHASTAGGNILVERAGSFVTASTAGGRIQVHEARGAVSAENSGGSIEVGSARNVRLESTGGAIRLKGSSGAIQAATDVGNIMAEFVAGVPIRDSLLSTGAGDVTVFIPSNLALTVKAQNRTGRAARVVSEFPEIFPARTVAAVSEGSLNGGGPVLTISATRGTIYLRRQR